ncbi:hypothetical protein QJQ45_023026, partial [Haematococcus lacustris]
MRIAGMLLADITSLPKFRSGVAVPEDSEEEGAVNPLAHLDADWLGCNPGKTNMVTVAHEERYPSGSVKSVWQCSLTAGQYYRQKGITEHAKESKTVTGAMVRCNSAATGRPLALAYGATAFSGSGTIGSKGVTVKQMLREACKQWLYPVRSMAKRSRIRGLRCFTSNVIKRRFFDRDVSAALHIRRIAA